VAFSFFVIPYAYFYYEKEDIEEEDDAYTRRARRMSALKYTLFFITVALALFLFGLFLKPTILPPHIDLEWFKNLLIESSMCVTNAFARCCLYFFFVLLIETY
jgi:LMBR1 domain-containing protein 1